MGYFVHPSSIIEPGASVGEGSKIWHFSHVMPTARIGQNCIIGQNVFVGENVIVGDNVKIQNNVSLYDGVLIENDVFIGPSVVFTNVLNPRSRIERKSEFIKTQVVKGASIGANATIICGVTLGSYCLVGAGAIVTHDIPKYSLYYGNPATLHGWVCQCGEKLQFENESDEETTDCKHCDRVFMKTGNNIKLLITKES